MDSDRKVQQPDSAETGSLKIEDNQPIGRAEAVGKRDKGQRKLLLIYRTTSRNHIALSAIADKKANFLLSVSTVLCSVAFTFLVAKGAEHPVYVLPGLFLIAVCMLTIIFAIIATSPHIGKGTFTPEQVKNRRANLLFFGNYFRMTSDEYEWALNEMLNDRKYLRKAISFDLYHLGVILSRKFRFLRISYYIFMIGTVVSIFLAYLAIEYHLTWFTEVFSEK